MEATYALLLVDGDNTPHLGTHTTDDLLCGLEYKASTQYATVGEPTSTTCAECARIARVVSAL